MAIIDYFLQLASSQAFTSTGLGLKSVDFGSVRQLGLIDEGLFLVVSVETAADSTTGDETYEFQIITSAAAGLGSPTVLNSKTVAAADLGKGAQVTLVTPMEGMKEFVGLNVVLGGTTPSITISAYLTSELPQANISYPAGI